MMIFSRLAIWSDDSPRTATAQMAVDESLLRLDGPPILRIYRWAEPAVTFGYAQRARDAQALSGGRPLVRRWTGGGVVFHGCDLTLCLAVPPSHSLASGRTDRIYRQIHEALLEALRPEVPAARLATPPDCLPGAACFASPALHDILASNTKICGGALRRGKRGVLYQGSLHAVPSPDQLGRALADRWTITRELPDVEPQARELDRGRYATAAWTHLR